MADFNLDGRLDVLLGKGGTTQFRPSWWATATGHLKCATNPFSSAGRPLFPESFSVESLIADDFNGDHIPDVIVFMPGMSGFRRPTVVSYLGNGDGTFRLAGFFDVLLSQQPGLLHVGVAADFNGDGEKDIAVAAFDNTIHVVLGNGDGTFQQASRFGGWKSTYYPTSVVVGDFNGDGRIDLACSYSTSVSILFGNGDGTFQPEMDAITDIPAPDLLIVGEFDGDGWTTLPGRFRRGRSSSSGEIFSRTLRWRVGPRRQ